MQKTENEDEPATKITNQTLDLDYFWNIQIEIISKV